MSSMDDSKLEEVSAASESSSNSIPPEESCGRLNQRLFEWGDEFCENESVAVSACAVSELIHGKSNQSLSKTVTND